MSRNWESRDGNGCRVHPLVRVLVGHCWLLHQGAALMTPERRARAERWCSVLAMLLAAVLVSGAAVTGHIAAACIGAAGFVLGVTATRV